MPSRYTTALGAFIPCYVVRIELEVARWHPSNRLDFSRFPSQNVKSVTESPSLPCRPPKLCSILLRLVVIFVIRVMSVRQRC